MDGIREWWEAHRAIKADIMRLVVQDWTLGCDSAVITAHVMRYLCDNRDWLPCPPREFHEKWFVDFWPEF